MRWDTPPDKREGPIEAATSGPSRTHHFANGRTFMSSVRDPADRPVEDRATPPGVSASCMSTLTPTALGVPGAQRPRRAATQEPGPGAASAGALHAPNGAGLVTSAITGRPTTEPPPTRVPDGLWEPNFPAADLVDHAAGLFEQLATWGGGAVGTARDAVGHEGPRHRVSIAPGCVGIAARDVSRHERTAEREQLREDPADVLAALALADGEEPFDPAPRGVIREWSAKSRARMVRRLCELDYAPLLVHPGRLPAMVTLTYPGDWLIVAPTGKTVKDHLKAFRKRYERAWGEPLRAVWKLEFQRRGAPHVHLLMVPPHGQEQTGRAFRQWLSETWAAVVAHPDAGERARHLAAGTGVDFSEGLRATDPKRVAVYFTKHGSFADKEYQHVVPEPWQEPGAGPGRFWGYWNLQRAVAEVEITPEDYVRLSRTMRRHQRAQRRMRTVRAPRPGWIGSAKSAHAEIVGLAGAELARGPLNVDRPIRRRKVNRRIKLYSRGSGWTSVNDGPAFASQLARMLDTAR